MRNSERRAWVRAAAFLVFLALVNSLLNFVLMPAGNFTRRMLEDLHRSEPLDVVFCGSSLALYHFDPDVLEPALNARVFDLGASSADFPASYYLLKEMFRTQSPRLVVLAVEARQYARQQEDPLVYVSLAPYLKSPLIRARYYWATAQDGSYLDRLLWWRGYHVKGPRSALQNVREKLFPDPDPAPQDGLQYVRDGYVYVDPSAPAAHLPDTVDETGPEDFTGESREYVQKIARLCRQHGVQLMLVNTPLPAQALRAMPRYFEADAAIAESARQAGVPYYNFNLARPELFSPRPEMFRDLSHMNADGARAFSAAFASFLQRLAAGEDVSGLFYTPEQAKERL